MDYDLEAQADAGLELAPIAEGGSGQVVTLHQPAGDGTFDPATDTTTGATPSANHTGSGVEEHYSGFSVASGVVAAGDVKFLLSPFKADGSLMPKPVADSWTLTYADGTRWTIKKVDAIRPAGNTALFILQLRGAG